MKQSVKASTRRKRRTSQDLRAAVLAAAEGEFSRLGYSGATTAEIARRAETTEAQIFRYYPSKADLFREAMVRPLDAHLRQFIETLASSDRAITDDAAAYIDELTRFIGRHEQMFRSLVMAEQQNVGGIATVDALGDYFARGAATMRQRGGDPPKIDPDVMVRISFAAVLGCELFADWLYPPGDFDRLEIRSAVTRFMIDGLYGNAESLKGNDNG